MYPVTQEFLEEMKADMRKIYGRVQVDYTSPFLDQSITITASENNHTSHPSQVADSIREPSGKFAVLGEWALGDDHVLAPGTPEAGQMGWWSEQVAQADGTFATPVSLTAEFHSRPIYELLVVGDNACEEYPVGFTIELYSEDVLVYTETVVSNTEIVWQKDIEDINEITKMVLKITKWSHPNRHAKILEFITSIQEVYEGDDIISINLLEEREVSQGSLPVGNISANEIDIKLNNESRKFDAGNKQSPLYQLLKTNRRIKAWLGADVRLRLTYGTLKGIKHSTLKEGSADEIYNELST